MKPKSEAQNRLFETAARLFYRRGYRAIGVDTLAAESGIGKMTLYRHYPSKEDLVLAFLRERDEDFWAHFEEAVTGAPTAREALLAFFQSLQGYVRSPACYGCAFLNVATEYPEKTDKGHRAALKHKQTVRARFLQLAQAAHARDPEALADALYLLMDGAYMAARVYGSSPDNPAANLADAARRMIDAYSSS